MAQKIRNNIFIQFLGIIGVISCLTVLFTPITWIWFGWTLAWKLLVTSISSFGISRFLTKAIEDAIRDSRHKQTLH